jgi:hypothetical protein
MPNIDRTTEIHITHGPQFIEVLIPMIGRPTRHWQTQFRKMAKTAQLHAAADDKPERFWIHFRVPADRSHRQITDMLDNVSMLIDDVNANELSPAAVAAEAAIRDWWTQQR